MNTGISNGTKVDRTDIPGGGSLTVVHLGRVDEHDPDMGSVEDWLTESGFCEEHKEEMIRFYLVGERAVVLSLPAGTIFLGENNVRLCRYCGKAFFSTRSSFCTRPLPGGGTCHSKGPSRYYRQLAEKDYPYREYILAAKRMCAKCRRETLSREAYLKWREKAAALFREYRGQNITGEDFIQWLYQTAGTGRQPIGGKRNDAKR